MARQIYKEKIKTDAKIRFYTGTASVALFSTTFTLIKRFIPHITYWKGRKHAMQILKRTGRKKNANIIKPPWWIYFKINAITIGAVEWRRSRSLRYIARKTLIYFYNLDKIIEQVVKKFSCQVASRSNFEIICLKHLLKLGIINVSRLCRSFHWKSKTIGLKAATWSEFKHHNTIKVLVDISPSRFITFLSSCYGGQASDKFIIKVNGFYDLPDHFNSFYFCSFIYFLHHNVAWQCSMTMQ